MSHECVRRLVRAAEHDVAHWHERSKFVVRYDNYRVVIMDNSELLDRNLLDRVAEHVGVLEPDVRQQDDPRADDVRCVVPAAEPCLDDGDVDACLGERVEGGGGDRLELRRIDALGCGANARQRRGQVGRRAVDPDPLAPRPHVGRERCPDGEPSASSSCSIVTVAVDFPFVPTTWTAG